MEIFYILGIILILNFSFYAAASEAILILQNSGINANPYNKIKNILITLNMIKYEEI